MGFDGAELPRPNQNWRSKQTFEKFKFFGLIFTIMIFIFVVISFPGIFITWVAGSAITSAMKSNSNECGIRYKSEVIFAGDWFCSTGDKD